MVDYPKTYEQEANSLVSKFNSAGLINLTIVNLWQDFYLHFRTAQYFKANADLDCLWIEFGGDIKEDTSNGKLVIDNFNKIEKKIADSFSIQINPVGFERPSDIQLISIKKQVAALKEKALFLRRLMNQQGKGTAYEESIDDYMEDGD